MMASNRRLLKFDLLELAKIIKVTYKGVLEICTFHKKSQMAGFSFVMPDDGFVREKREAGKIIDKYLQIIA
jgi:hypothetical protein